MSIQQKLHLKIGPRLHMTPSLQQAIKLLPLARLELQNYLAQEMQVNPILEEQITTVEDEEYDAEKEMEIAEENTNIENDRKVEDTFDYEAFFRDYFDLSYTPNVQREITEYPSFENTLATQTTLTDHLEWQLGVSNLPELEDRIVREIIGNLDEKGYLQSSIEEIAQSGPYELADVERGLSTVQQLDPVGIGARDLQECLLIQAHHYGFTGTPVESMIREMLDLLRNHNYQEISRRLKCSLPEVQKWMEVIKHFDPVPGLKYSSSAPQYVTPDVYVVKMDGEYKIILDDDGIPRLRINPLYRRMLEDKGTPEETVTYIKDKIKSALWLIKSIDQRQKTIYKVADSIVRHQRAFLDYGIDFLKPLILKTVADDIGMHESTVSRAVTNKYMHTPQGVYEMKFFFHSSLSNSRGVDISSLSIKEKIRKMIDAEDPLKPLSDSEITSNFQREGLKISRRTVAKYREDMKIPASHQRRSVISQ
jgi:RNA polymerase sigma-54 factor